MNERVGGELPSSPGKFPARGLPSSLPLFFFFFLVCCTCLFLEVPIFSSSPLPALEVQEETSAGSSPRADLHFLTDAGGRVSPPGLSPRTGGGGN